MSRQLLKEYIKKAIREKIQQQKRIEANKEKSVYLIYKFPGLKKVFIDLMSPAFARFIQEVKIVSPKPTTFSIKLVNGMDFTVYYSGRGKFIAKVAGKKYFTDNLGDIQRGSQAITNLLELNYNEEELSAKKDVEQTKTNDLKSALGGGGGGAPSSGGPGIDPDAPADATIPGEETGEEPNNITPGEGEPGEEPEGDEGEEEENPKP